MAVKRHRFTAGHGLPMESGDSFADGLLSLGLTNCCSASC